MEAIGTGEQVVQREVTLAFGRAGAALGDQATKLRPTLSGAGKGCGGKAGIGNNLCARDEAWHMGEQMAALVGDVVWHGWADGAALGF